jgi:hypothetical protein
MCAHDDSAGRCASCYHGRPRALSAQRASGGSRVLPRLGTVLLAHATTISNRQADQRRLAAGTDDQ